MSASNEEWGRAQAIALGYLKTDKLVAAAISVRWYEWAPFLFSCWWDGGQARVLVYDGVVHPERGVAALPGFFASLGEARLRAMTVGQLDGLLQGLEAGVGHPAKPRAVWDRTGKHEELYPVLRDEDGVLSYVGHYIVPYEPFVPPPTSGPRPPFGGSRAPGWQVVFEKWSLQLWPVVPDLAWKLEAKVEREP